MHGTSHHCRKPCHMPLSPSCSHRRSKCRRKATVVPVQRSLPSSRHSNPSRHEQPVAAHRSRSHVKPMSCMCRIPCPCKSNSKLCRMYLTRVPVNGRRFWQGRATAGSCRRQPCQSCQAMRVSGCLQLRRWMLRSTCTRWSSTWRLMVSLKIMVGRGRFRSRPPCRVLREKRAAAHSCRRCRRRFRIRHAHANRPILV